MRKKQPVTSLDPLDGIGQPGQPEVTGPVTAIAEEPPVAVATTTAVQTVALGESLTIADVAAAHADFAKWMLAAQPLEVDASAVEMVDGAGLQLLAAARRTAAAKGLTIHLLRPSDALQRAASQLGLDEILMAVDGAPQS